MSDIDYRPWLYRDHATPEIRARQAEFQSQLAKQGHTIGEEVYLSELAAISGQLTIGDRSYIAAGALISREVDIGTDVSINAYTMVHGKCRIGNYTRIASHTTIIGFNHDFDDIDTPIHHQGTTSQGIEIGEDVWIGVNVVIVDGVTIGSHSVIGAGSVVTRDIPPYSIAVGNPAKVVRDRRHKQTKSPVHHLLQQFGEQTASEWQSVLKNSQQRYKGETHYIDPQHNQPAIRTLCNVVEIAAMFDGLDQWDDINPIVDTIQPLQQPDSGLVPDPWLGPETMEISNNRASFHILAVGYALELVGRTLNHPIHAAQNIDADTLFDKLNHLPWDTRAWWCGAWIDHYSTAIYFNTRYFDNMRGIDPVIGWLNTHINPATGMWGNPTASQKWLQPVNSFYRLTRGSFAQFGLPLPYPETSIDTIFQHIRQYDDFMAPYGTGHPEVSGCNVLDIIHPLWLCSQQTDYRAAEIREYTIRQLQRTIKAWVPKHGFAFSDGVEIGLQGTEMWLTIVYLMADLLDGAEQLGYAPKGIHRLQPAVQSCLLPSGLRDISTQ